MPRTIKQHERRLQTVAARYEKSLAERDEAIRDAYKAGLNYRQIAPLVGLSHMGVQKIVKRGERD